MVTLSNGNKESIAVANTDKETNTLSNADKPNLQSNIWDENNYPWQDDLPWQDEEETSLAVLRNNDKL